MLKLALDEVVEVMTKIASEPDVAFDTPEGAFSHCGDANLAFIQLLETFGMQGEGTPMVDEKEGGCHVVTRVGDLYFDFTKRQYGAHHPFPCISTRWQLEAEGWRLDLTPEEQIAVRGG